MGENRSRNDLTFLFMRFNVALGNGEWSMINACNGGPPITGSSLRPFTSLCLLTTAYCPQRVASCAIRTEDTADLQAYGSYLLAGIPTGLKVLFSQAYQKGARIHSNTWGGGKPGEYDEQCRQLDQWCG